MYRVLLGVPGSGMLCETASQASHWSSAHHRVHRFPSNQSGPNFNACLQMALNECQEGHYDFFAMMHTDVAVVNEIETCRDCHGEKCWECAHVGKRIYNRWLDILIEEQQKVDADFISVPMAIKSIEHCTSSGIGNPANRWNPWRRFCTNEFKNWPTTFCADDIGYGDKYLLHNNAFCLFDMRKPLWWETDSSGCIRAMFNLTEDIRRNPLTGVWERRFESEDWAFSRRLWELGARTYITSRIATLHHGSFSYENNCQVGTWQNGDEGTASQWRTSTGQLASDNNLVRAS